MKLKNIKSIIPVAVITIAAFGLGSCTGDLNVENINPQQVSTFDQDAIFNKIYANMVLTGQTGPDGNKDIEGIDEGTSNFIRQVWNANELTTDEAHCLWGDAGIPEFNHNAWSDAHPMMQALYYRLYFGITVSNFFLQQTSNSDQKTNTQRAEARFMRALFYYYLMDFYGNVPMVTTVSSEKAQQAKRADVFKFIESELKAIDGEDATSKDVLADAKTNTYGRADKAAAWLLLSRLYLNAEVYTGTANWSAAKDYANKVINSGYTLSSTAKNGYSGYQLLFMGDNDTNGAQNEIILPAIHDGVTTQTWGGCLFIIASTANADIKTNYPYGTSENWGGNRCRPQFVKKFFPNDDAPVGTPTEVKKSAGDDRALFYTKGHTLDVSDETDFTKGYAYIKFLNLHADGTATKHTQFVDTDFPMMRAAEAYLNYAEADARLNNGECTTDGIAKIKALRTRANANTNLSKFTLDQIIDEWSREFGFEGRRRMDLIRFGEFGGQNKYKWEWMGGTKSGSSFDSHFNIFAIPSSDLNANSNLTQNPKY
ncbi:MAG: RagB/SusD family nutrient uptake outer membrane protein [Bacteroidaceae bacterium]|nr:RagB/SusD family nutrient uptake outer membrane protein [Bacteroidaceae bacterium]